MIEPIYQCSTFTFTTAEEGERAFAIAYGIVVPEPDEEVSIRPDVSPARPPNTIIHSPTPTTHHHHSLTRFPNTTTQVPYIYSRVGNPNMNSLERRITKWDGAEQACVFSSG